MKVVSRGLFLTVSVMLVFLYVFDMTTILIARFSSIRSVHGSGELLARVLLHRDPNRP